MYQGLIGSTSWTESRDEDREDAAAVGAAVHDGDITFLVVVAVRMRNQHREVKPQPGAARVKTDGFLGGSDSRVSCTIMHSG